MTVRELIEALGAFDPDATVEVWDNDTGEYYAPELSSYAVFDSNRPGGAYTRVAL
jgi:hypothetical protein